MNLQAIKQRFGIIGQSVKLDRALSTAVRVASTDLTVMIQGESGVGKEVFSKIIHSLSARKHNKFIAINCGAIPEGTINSELFGHEKGSFTGATAERKGYFETVNSGTIFLDEIGEMPLDTQSYLLRILESGEFIRVGSSKVLKTDVRVIAATNKNLEDKIRSGKFREDLYYRLNTVPIKVPSLKERREDIYMLFRKFAVDFAEKYRTSPIQLDDQARQVLESYPWPGNIRELKNVIEQISVLSESHELSLDELIDLVPNLVERRLPMKRESNFSAESFQEREILYKLLFDMKGDLNDLKTLVFELIRSNNLEVSNIPQLNQFESRDLSMPRSQRQTFPGESYKYEEPKEQSAEYNQPIIISRAEEEKYQKSEIVEENLSLEMMEKEMILKALDKHKGRRRDAAEELGISERTLYRKIKQYELQ
jgi:transcriptional regulator with PAS, ATPase and Fis domain